MTPEHWQQVDRLLELALEREPRERPEFLDKQCAGNMQLRQEVEALLKAHEQAGSFIEAPALEGAAKGFGGHRTESWVGQQLGNYKILSMLGAGGMGEVYLAQDSRLGRKIALKLLPRQFTYDKDRLRRFEREAQAASALNHPNILTIHEIGQAGDTTFIASEFVDGQTLRQRIIRSRLELPETLDIAIQVTSALAAAHESHIVHRDIKPENIMLRRDGYVKVLDFGLAKLMEANPASSTGTVSLLTESGMLVGTLQYMSPEQARGQEVDARTDIFSLGAVLYEMTTGTMPFKGSTVAAVSDAILNQTPAPPHQLNSDVPEELERIIVKALEKDREVRYQTASDLRADLKRVQRDAALLQAAKVPGPQVEPTHQSSVRATKPREWLRIAGMLAALVVALWAGWYIWQPARPQRAMIQRQLTTNSSETPIYTASISPDGRKLAYSEENGLYVKQIDTGESYGLSALASSRVLHVAWFPDGDRLLVSATATDEKVSGLWTVPIGGPARKLRDDASAASVSPDGATIAFIGENSQGIWVMSASGEQPRRIVQAGQGDIFHDLTWFPNSQRLAYFRHHLGEDPVGDSFESCDLRGNQTATTIPGGWFKSCWVSPDGRLLYSTANWKQHEAGLWEIRIDLSNGQAIGTPRNLFNWPGLAFVWLSGSTNGKRLGLFRGISQDDVYVGKLEGGGTRLTTIRRLTLDDRGDYPAAWTADSKAVLFSSDRNGNFDIFKQALDQRLAEPVVTGPEDQCDPTLTPDGASILYFAQPGGRRLGSLDPVSLSRAPLASGPPQLVLNERGFAVVNCARSPSNLCVVDQRTKGQLVFYAFDPSRGKGGELTRVDVSPNAQYVWDLSPDGSRIALIRSHDEQGRLQVLSLTGERSYDVVVQGGHQLGAISWAADGNGWFVSSRSEGSITLLFVDLKGQAQVLWRQSTLLRFLSETWGVPSPDGRYIAFTASTLSGDAWMMENF
jgi:serine/threonine protein kinase/Tol biopolymer transport system component